MNKVHIHKLKIILKKAFICLTLFVMFFGHYSYAEESQEYEKPVVSQEDAGNAMGWFARNYCSNHRDDTEYGSDNTQAYLLERISGKFQMNTNGWISFVVHNSLGLGSEDSYTQFVNLASSNGGNISINDSFEFVMGAANKTGEALKQEDVEKFVKIGDILVEKGGTKAAIYEGGNIAYCASPADEDSSPLYEIRLYPKEENEEDDDENPVNNNEEERTVFTDYCAIIRITEAAANGLDASEVTSLLEEDHIAEDNQYSKYYGTTKGEYVGSYSFNLLAWIFNSFLGFMEYLFGIIALLFRAPFIGWTNIVENLINDTINNISGIKTTDLPEDANTQARTIAGDEPSAMDVYVSKRINIEDIVYDNVPMLDIDVFDVNFSKYTESGLITIDNDSILLVLRHAIISWYYSIRNLAAIVLLLLLVYLGIRLAIATTAERKANYKKLLVAWATSFIILFTLHYFMIIVIEINTILVDKFKEVNISYTSEVSGGNTSLYDTVRTRAYSLKLSEGFPATILYMILVYYLCRFLFVYVKRFFTICILTLLGPFMAIKYAFESINKGGNNTGSIIAWMYDYALNVLLQAIHAILYTIFMGMAFDFAISSVSGFIFALFIINFMLKAEDLFRRIFNFNGRAGSMENVTANDSKKIKGNTIFAAKAATGAALFFPKLGFGLIKNTTKSLLNDNQNEFDIMDNDNIFYNNENQNGTENGEISLSNTSGDNLAYGEDSGSSSGGYSQVDGAYGENENNSLDSNSIDGEEKGKQKRKRPSLSEFIAGVRNDLPSINDDIIQPLTGERSLRLDLIRLSQTDPYRYRQIKNILDKQKQLKRQVMKRTLKRGVLPVKALAKAMVGVPMFVVDPHIGFQVLTSAKRDFSKIAKNNKKYNQKRKIKLSKPTTKKRKILGKVGRVAALSTTISYFGVNTAAANLDSFNKDLRKIRKNERMINDIREAESLKFEIEGDIEQLDRENVQNESYDDLRARTIEIALDSVLNGRNLNGAINNYMRKNNLTKLSTQDIEGILREFNLDGIESEIGRLKLSNSEQIRELNEKLTTLKSELKSNIEDANEIKQVLQEIKQTNDEKDKASVKKDVYAGVQKEIAQSGNLSEGMFKQDIIGEIVEEYITQTHIREVTEDDIRNIVGMYNDRVESRDMNVYALREQITRKLSKKVKTKPKEKSKVETKDKEVKKNDVIESILDSIAEGVPQTPKTESGKKGDRYNNQKTVFGNNESVSEETEERLRSVSDKIKRLKVLYEKGQMKYKSRIIDIKDFEKDIKKNKWTGR